MYEYQPQNIIVTWGGIPFLGFAKDSIVMAEFDEEAVTKTIGSKGEAAATVNANRAGKVTVDLLQGSPLNTILSAQAASIRPRGASLVVRPFIITDLGGLTYAVGPEAWIQKVPPITFKKDQEVRSWVFDVAEWTKIINGGTRPA